MLLTAIGFGFVYWIARYDESVPMRDMVVRFDGSVAGLYKGANVLFNGIKVGEVSDLNYDPEHPQYVKALLEVDSRIPLKDDSRIELAFQGLTGVATVEIKGGSVDLPNLMDQPSQPEMLASSSAMEDLMKGARQVLARADSVLNKVERVVTTNEERVNNSIENIETFTTALKNNAEGIDTFMADASSAAKGISSLSERLATLSDKAETLLTAVDPESVKTSVENIEQLTTNLTTRIDTLGAKADSLLDAVNPESVKTSVANVETFTNALKNNAEGIDTFMADASSAAKGISALSERLEKLSDRAETLLAAVDPETVGNSFKNIETFSENLAGASERFDGVIDEAALAAKGINEFSGNLTTSLAKVDKLVDSVDPEAVRTAVSSLSNFAASLEGSSDDIGAVLSEAKSAAGNFNTFSETMASRSEDINHIITDTRQLSARLNEASKRVDGILGKVDGILSSDENGGKGLVEEVTLAARSIRRVSEKFESRADEIAGGLARFSGRGLRDVESMVSEARQTLQRLEGAVGKIEDDPSSIIFGGNKVKTYNRRY